jgi:hypothetical protein
LNIKKQNLYEYDDVLLPSIVKPKSRGRVNVEKEAVIKIQVAINRHMNRKNSKLRQREYDLQDTYMKAAIESQHELRSATSRDNDPVLPQKIEAVRHTIKEGMFTSKINRNYVFMYRIHYDGN